MRLGKIIEPLCLSCPPPTLIPRLILLLTLCLMHQFLGTEGFFYVALLVGPAPSHFTVSNSIQSLKTKGGSHTCACIHFLRAYTLPEIEYKEAKWQETKLGAVSLFSVNKLSCWLRRNLAEDIWQQGNVQVQGSIRAKEGEWCVWAQTCLKEGSHTWGHGSGELRRERREDSWAKSCGRVKSHVGTEQCNTPAWIFHASPI